MTTHTVFTDAHRMFIVQLLEGRNLQKKTLINTWVDIDPREAMCQIAKMSNEAKILSGFRVKSVR